MPKVSTQVGSDFVRSSSGTAVGTAGVLVVSAKLGRLYRLQVVNGSATAYYLQIFDKATAPVNTDVPIDSFRLAVSSEREIDYTNVNGLYFALGCGIAISSTPGVLTLAVADNIAFYRAFYTKNA